MTWAQRTGAGPRTTTLKTTGIHSTVYDAFNGISYHHHWPCFCLFNPEVKPTCQTCDQRLAAESIVSNFCQAEFGECSKLFDSQRNSCGRGVVCWDACIHYWGHGAVGCFRCMYCVCLWGWKCLRWSLHIFYQAVTCFCFEFCSTWYGLSLAHVTTFSSTIFVSNNMYSCRESRRDPSNRRLYEQWT